MSEKVINENKFCQSCAMPLNIHGEDVRGHEHDGSLSSLYCKYCYVDGEFTNKEITYEEMVNMGIKGIKSNKGSKLAKWLMVKSYPMMLKKTARYKDGIKRF